MLQVEYANHCEREIVFKEATHLLAEERSDEAVAERSGAKK